MTVKQEFRDKEVKESITEKNLDIKEISIKDNHTKSSIPVKNDGSLDFDGKISINFYLIPFMI